MHLKTIKLAGFKSFVDPTTIQLRSPLTAIVGPNGCGKSNIVDAIRWVIGESSAKYLRAQDMSEVIFNGTALRKPLAQAAVELIFDNSDGSLGGEYAAYAEISVRRVVERDGQSNYFLNNHRCRRRDITDIFLGTGLGPRSYAIIEQGMVTRLIDAKPEELAAYLKEVAGISKYEERRKETELHIRHTKENLNRANDICLELTQQLERLQQQVAAAEKFRVLKEEARLLKAQLQAMHWRSLEQESELHKTTIAEQETQLAEGIAAGQSLEIQIEALRTQHSVQSAEGNALQSSDYQLGTEITRLEQKIQYTRERHQQSEKDLLQLDQQMEALKKHMTQDKLQQAELEAASMALEPEIEQAAQGAEQSRVVLGELESKIQEDQLQWDQFVSREAQTIKQLEFNQHRIDTLEQRIAATSLRQARLNAECSEIALDDLYKEVADLDVLCMDLESASKTSQQNSADLQQKIQEQRIELTEQNAQLVQQQAQLQNLQGRLSSLETMQQAALGQDDQFMARWLEEMNLHQKPRLAQKIQVQEGWELAVETVLADCLSAVCIEDFKTFAQTLSGTEALDLAVFSTQASPFAEKENPQLGKPLLSKIKAPWSLASLLSGVYTADTLTQAIERSSFLQAHESIITAEGVWLGQTWLRINPREKEQTGVLAREQALHELNDAMTRVQVEMTAQEKRVQDSRDQLQHFEQAHQSLQQELAVSMAKRSDQQAQLAMKRSQWSHLQKRQADLQLELAEMAEQLMADHHQLSVMTEDLKTAQQKAQQDALERSNLREQRSERQVQRETLRNQAKTTQETWQAANKRLESMRQQIQFLLQNIARAEQQWRDLLKQRENIEATDKEALSPLADMEKNLAELLASRNALQINLGQVKQQLAELDQQLSELNSQKQRLNQTVHELRTLLEPLQIEKQTAVIRASTIKDQLVEIGQDPEALLNALPENANENLWQERLERNTRRLDKLGPINLAALDEYNVLLERKQEMDAQQQDLNEALNTLEEAITKIDQETRVLFKETFDKVNASFQALFPKIFIGGVGGLALTEGDLFTAGVMIRVQPAGKRNSNIQALSGGEKALTAITLIFALFQLNPAPFCILDEVDAPLDDQNVGRFCDIVKEMAQHVQFIVVTHNKLAMEIAEQLMGITMQEPGVSRTVAVDIEEAMAYAA